jgi:hypothetical protein
MPLIFLSLFVQCSSSFFVSIARPWFVAKSYPSNQSVSVTTRTNKLYLFRAFISILSQCLLVSFICTTLHGRCKKTKREKENNQQGNATCMVLFAYFPGSLIPDGVFSSLSQGSPFLGPSLDRCICLLTLLDFPFQLNHSSHIFPSPTTSPGLWLWLEV